MRSLIWHSPKKRQIKNRPKLTSYTVVYLYSRIDIPVPIFLYVNSFFSVSVSILFLFLLTRLISQKTYAVEWRENNNFEIDCKADVCLL